jgi:hypothetical protein
MHIFVFNVSIKDSLFFIDKSRSSLVICLNGSDINFPPSSQVELKARISSSKLTASMSQITNGFLCIADNLSSEVASGKML